MHELPILFMIKKMKKIKKGVVFQFKIVIDMQGVKGSTFSYVYFNNNYGC